MTRSVNAASDAGGGSPVILAESPPLACLALILPDPGDRKQRVVPVPDWVVDVLDRHLGATGKGAKCQVAHQRGSRCQSNLVFTSPQAGGVLDIRNARNRHRYPTLKTAGLGQPASTTCGTPTEATWPCVDSPSRSYRS